MNNLPNNEQPNNELENNNPLNKLRNNKLITIASLLASIVLIAVGIFQVRDGISGLFGGNRQTIGFETISVPATTDGNRELPELPDEASFEDFIGAFPDEFYFSILIAGYNLTVAEADSVTYARFIEDGVKMEVIFESDTILFREGGRGNFDEVDIGQVQEAADQMVDGMSTMIMAMQFQYTFNRDTFDEMDITIIGYDAIAGRDVIVYEIVLDVSIHYTVYLDVDTNLILKYNNHFDDSIFGLFELEVFKTCGFSFPD